MVKVIKRDGETVAFDKEKIFNAIYKAMRNGSGLVNTLVATEISNEIELKSQKLSTIKISDIETEVYNRLIEKGHMVTARAYEGYRAVREFQRQNENTIDKDIKELLSDDSDYWKTENANKNPVLNTTKRDYIAGIVSTDAAKRYLLPPDVVQADEEGIIHFHDKDYFIQNEFNCDLVNLEDMLQNGTVISDVLIEKPKSLLTACTIATQGVAQVSSSQYGGQSLSAASLSKFIDVSRQKIKKSICEELNSLKIEDVVSNEEIDAIVEKRVKSEIRQSVQTIQYQLTTIMTTNGQAPFITIFMYLNEAANEREKKDLALFIEEILNQRIQGVKNEDGVYIAPAFPKLIYVLEEDNCKEGTEYWYLTKLAAECSSKRLVPDYISEKIMKEVKNGDVFPCMGCVDGSELVTYKYKEALYVEGFQRMWDRLTDYFEIKEQYPHSPNVYMDLKNVDIYDTKKGFVNTKRIIRNLSNDWVDVHFSNGRRLLCTTDHPFEIINKGETKACNLKVGDGILISNCQYSEQNINFNIDRAWLLGFMLCNGCYQNNHVFSSIAATGEDEIEENIIRIFREQFNFKSETILQNRGKKGTYKDIHVRADKCNSLQKLINYFTQKFSGINKINRHMPNEVFSWNTEAKFAFMAGMIDADGYINSSNKNKSIVQIGSANKELALQQAALAKALDMPAKLYHNHYSKNNPFLIRYRVEFKPSCELLKYIVCTKKTNNFTESKDCQVKSTAEVISVTPVERCGYSYDVTTDSEHFEVSGIFSHNCRSFLSPYTDEGGNPKYYGRFNQGVVTLNLADVALSSNKNFNDFWKLMDERTELCHKALKIRHQRLLGTTSDVAPILWRYGAIARLNKGEKIDKLLYNGYSTISLGYAGLYECVKYMTGHSHSDEGIGENFGLKVMQYLNDKCNKWAEEENIAYSPYGTPLEATTFKFAKKLRERFGIVKGITDRNYITNSYHIPVFEPITAFEKLRIESKFQRLSPGGAISYIETPNLSKNPDSLLEVIKYIYDNIMYAEINTKSCFCEKCGYDGDIPIIDQNGTLKFICPQCGNDDSSTMDIAFRTCGYIGTSKNGANQGRMGDIHDRVYHLDDVAVPESGGDS